MFPQSLGSTPHRRASIHATPMCCLQKHIAETQKMWNIKPPLLFLITGKDTLSQGNDPHSPNVQHAQTHCRNSKGVVHLITRSIPNHWEAHPTTTHPSTLSQCAFAKSHCRTTQGEGNLLTRCFPNHWGARPIARHQSILPLMCSLRSRIAEKRRCGTSDHKMYSQSRGSTLHGKASIHTAPMWSLQNRNAETQWVWNI
jgi:hypothetical protein